MDYLTVLSTQRVELFITRPSLSSPPVHVAPVTMSLLALIRDDTFCAFFLLDHIMENIGAQRMTLASSNTATTETRAIMQAAEVKVWEEICRAKSFARTLGYYFEANDRVTELELATLAASHGIGLAHSAHATLNTHPHAHTHDKEHEHHFHHHSHDKPVVRAPAHAHAPAVAPVLV